MLLQFYEPTQRMCRGQLTDYESDGQVGKEELAKAHVQHTACLLPSVEFHQLGADGRGKDDTGEQTEDSSRGPTKKVIPYWAVSNAGKIGAASNFKPNLTIFMVASWIGVPARFFE